MHLVYDTRTGAVVDGPNTGGGWGPDGIPDEAALVNITEDDRPFAAIVRLEDDDPAVAEILTIVATHQLRVVDGHVIAGEPWPPPPELPPVVTVDDRLGILLQRLATAQTMAQVRAAASAARDA